ncbi:MAG: DUF3486 family protein [Magnetococcales bacterium]|nr:DUF3486 family protein [Magnetococcales bacterium]
MTQRSLVESLPADIRSWIDQALVEGNFSGYQALEELLRAKGYEISKSAIHRYGQAFERRLGALKLATEQARAITEAAPDDEDAVSQALVRLYQERTFDLLLKMEIDPKISFASLGQAIAQISGTSTTLKRYQSEVRAKTKAVARDAEHIARQGGLSAEAAASIRQAILGIPS